MKRWKTYAAGLLLTAALSPQGQAQVPAAPAAAAPAAAAPAAAPPPANMWSMICLSPEQLALCKAKLCSCGLVQLMNNGLKPIGAFSGGIIGPCCPLISPAALAMPADSPEGAAARAMADAAGVKARREAVRYLGTLDCHYWPEAQEALINALRGDRSECVRLEAAFALNRGCCCTRPIIKALVICVSSSDEDGFPRECCERVRAVAQAALAHCLECYIEIVPVVPDKGKEPMRGEAKPSNTPDKLPTNLGQHVNPADYYKHVQTMSRQEIIEDSQRVLAKLPPLTMPVQAPEEMSSNGLLDVFNHAFGGTTTTVTSRIVAETPGSTSPVKTESVTTIVPVPSTPVAITPAPITPAPITPAPITPAPITPAPITPAPITPAPITPVTPTPTTPVKATPLATPAIPVKATPLTAPPTPATPFKATPVAEKTSTVSANVSSTTVPGVARPMPSAPGPMPQVQPTPVARQVVSQRVAPVAGTDNGMNMTLPQVVRTLRESPYPEYRDWAAQNLSSVDGWTNPDVVQALASTARSDRIATVRAACVRSLGKMRCGSMVAMNAVQAAKADPDTRVRQEAETALQLMGTVDPNTLKVPSGH
jgi:hypothetical protein